MMTRHKRRLSYSQGFTAGCALVIREEAEDRLDADYFADWARLISREGQPSRRERAYWLGVARGIRAAAQEELVA